MPDQKLEQRKFLWRQVDFTVASLHFVRLYIERKVLVGEQGIILVAIPLVFEVLFLMTLGGLLAEAEAKAEEIEHSRKIMVETDGLIAMAHLCAASLFQYHTTQSLKARDEYDRTIDEMPVRFARLEELVGNDPVEKKHIDNIRPRLALGIKVMREMRAAADDRESLHEVWKAHHLTKDLFKFLRGLIVGMQQVTIIERSKHPNSPEELAKDRLVVKQFVVIGVALNIFVALAAAAIFTRNLARRVEVLTENTVRLSTGGKLLEPQHGEDEIARLDSFFHSMAKRLREQEELLRASEERTRSTIQNMLVGLVIIDDDGTINSINKRTEELFELSESEIKGRRITSLFADTDNMTIDSFLAKIASEAMGRVSDMTGRRKSGTFPIEVALTKMQTVEGTKLVLNILDVTERYEVERLKKELLSMVSHDLRTPPTSVHSSLSLLGTGAYGKLNDGGMELIENSEAEVDRLIALIGDLLDIARMEAGKLDLNYDERNLTSVIESSVKALKVLADMNKVKFKIPDEDFIVTIDGDRIVQVLVNLLSNALKFSPQNSVIEVGVERKEGNVEVSVIDQGPGIPSEFEARIFQRFEQAGKDESGTGDASGSSQNSSQNAHSSLGEGHHSAGNEQDSPGNNSSANEDSSSNGPFVPSLTSKASPDGKRVSQGTGLGLAICRGIIECHGGAIGARNNLNGGSTFWFSVPADPTT